MIGPAIVLGSTLLVCVALFLTSPHYFTRDDNANYFLPTATQNWRSLTEYHEFPFVNFHQSLGVPHFAAGQPAVLYPPLYLALAASVALTGDTLFTIDIATVLHLLASALGMYFVLRRISNCGTTVSILGSLLWITFPYVLLIARSGLSYTYTAAYLPFIILSLDALIRRPCAQSAAVLAAVRALFFFSGNIQFPIIVFVFELFLFVFSVLRFNTRKERMLRLRWFILHLILFLCLAAPLWLPMLPHVIFSHRAVPITSTYLAQVVARPLALLRAQLFQFDPHVWYLADGSVLYIGFTVIALFCFAFLPQMWRRVRTRLQEAHLFPYALCAVIALLLATPIGTALYWVPILNLFTAPIKYFLFALFFGTIVLASIAEAGMQHQRQVIRGATHLLLALSVCCNLFVAWGAGEQGLPGRFAVKEPPSAVRELLKKQDGRVVAYSAASLYEYEDASRYLMFNFATLWDAFSIGGYDPLQPLPIRAAIGYMKRHAMISGELDAKQFRMLDRWSVRYLITPATTRNLVALNRLPQLQQRVIQDDVAVYENMQARPFAYLEREPEQLLSVQFGGSTATVGITAQQDDTLVLSVFPLPQYIVEIDGARQAALALTYEPARIPVLAGTHSVVVRYKDTLFIDGIAVALLGVLFFWWVALHDQKTGHRTIGRLQLLRRALSQNRQ